MNLFTDGQLNFNGQTLFPERFDLSQAALAAAAGKDAWSKESLGPLDDDRRHQRTRLPDEDLAAESEGGTGPVDAAGSRPETD